MNEYPKRIWIDNTILDNANDWVAQPHPEDIKRVEERRFVRLSEEEVTEILTSAYDMYAAICAVENRLVEKNNDR